MKRLVFFCLLAGNSLIALPSGGELIQGHAALLPSANALQVNANGKAILHWEEFNIASHEAVHFIQSQGSQAILNRVSSGPVSEILGTLHANCPIYLINPQGVFIGSSACIDTAGFLASTADLSNEAFWQGSEMVFQDFGKGSIVNLGKISASQGDVFLIARAIDNQGKIEVPNGVAVLATHEMMLHPETKECVFIRVDETAAEEEGIQNSGTIQALTVELKTRSPYEKAIRHTGSIEAFATLEENGRIYLVAEEGGTIVDGSLFAASGEIRVLGQTVVLEEGSVIDVSGEHGGGTVLIGGDYQGKNENIKNAKHTWVGKETLVRADALSKGNGGKVIVWSDEATFHYGRINVRGGVEGGDGGFVEVSGPMLDYRGFVDGRAPFGKMGELLLDPNDVVIDALMTTLGGTFSACGPSNYNFVNGTATNQILNTDLQTQLGACSVTIDTTSGSAAGGAGPNNGSITVSSSVLWGANTTLTLTARSFISISASITNTSMSTGFTAMNFTANGVGATSNPGILLSAGTITTTGGGNVILNGTSSTATNATYGIFLNGGGISTGSGNISVTGLVPLGATGNTIIGLYMNTLNGIRSSSGNITLSGTSNSSGPGAQGIAVIQSWTTGTTGILAFQNCQGGPNVSVAITFFTPLSTGGNIIATQNIGSAPCGGGFYTSSSVSSTGGNIQITASGIVYGIRLDTGGLLSTAGGDITLNGMGGPGSTALSGIFFTGGQVTTLGIGNITLLGTSGSGYGVFLTGASSLIQSANGLISVTGNSGGTGANAEGIGVFSSAKINVTGSGGITLNGTASATGGNNSRGIVVNGSSSTVTTVSGNIIVNGTGGGTGSSSSGLEVSAGGKISSTSASITGTDVGGAGTTGCNGIFITGMGSQITTATGSGINLIGTGSGTTTNNQGILLQTGGAITTTNNAPITLIGTGSISGISGNAGIALTGDATTTVSTVNGNIHMTATVGGGFSSGGIEINSGATVISATSGLITLICTNFTVHVDNNSRIRTLGVGGPGINDISVVSNGLSLTGGGAGSAVISTANGNITIASSGNVSLTAGAAIGAPALIQSTVQGSITLSAQNFTIQAGSLAGQSGILTPSGNISLSCTQNATLSATTPGASAIVRTLGSNLTMAVGGSINLVGALISTPAPTGNLLLIAGVNITIDGTSQVSAFGSIASSLTFVVDNNFPSPPKVGPGQFVLSAGGIVSAGANTPVRIYTARRSQNTISNSINGMVFTPGPFAVNTSTETWSTYYPGGGYGGAAFNLYYKEPIFLPASAQRVFFNLIAANLTELPYLLPVLNLASWYHFQVCNQKDCDPTFSPYGSFIFEDGVYWIGTDF